MGRPSWASKPAETRMDAGLEQLFLCIKFRGERLKAGRSPASGAPSGLTPRSLAHTRSQSAHSQVPKHGQER